MSIKADIDDVFSELLTKHIDIKSDILAAKFGVYESLGWDESAGEVVNGMVDQGIDIDGNMRCYLNT
ncbi:MAG: hypothetical protein OEL79_04720 [Chromatiales bacterium]|nr:hypothetical protein [Chromatiales bacterium]